MSERGLSVDHVTIWRWVKRHAPVLSQRIRRELRHLNRSIHTHFVRYHCANRFPSDPAPLAFRHLQQIRFDDPAPAGGANSTRGLGAFRDGWLG